FLSTPRITVSSTLSLHDALPISLRGNAHISEQTRRMIHRVARDLGYVPNAAARSLARRASRTLGLLVPDVTDPLHSMIVAGFGRDRKSTRLNSSHVKISYAVFCL